MSDSRFNARQPADPDADQLNAAWNDLVNGRAPRAGNDLSDVVSNLHAGAPDVQPRSTFKRTLKENIMQTALASPGSMSAPTQPAVSNPRLGSQPVPWRPSTKLPADYGSAINKWVAIAAAVLIAFTTAAGAYLGGFYPGGNDSAGTFVAAPNFNAEGTPVFGTPEAETINPNPCHDAECLRQTIFGQSHVPDGVDVSFARLQSWEVAGGVTATFNAPLTETTGLGVDIVMEGAYQGTFSEPTVITRVNIAGTTSGNAINYVPANEVAELAQGDTISYALGSKRSIVNPLENRQLAVKTMAFYNGDPSAENLGATGVSNYRDNGPEATALSPDLIAILADREATVSFSYMRVYDSDILQPDVNSLRYVLGPVDGPRAHDEKFTEGFVIWISSGEGKG